MARRTGPSDRVLVDLGAFGQAGSEGPEQDETWRDGADGPGGPTDDGPTGDGRRSRDRRVRGAVAAATVVLLALTAWGTTSEVADHRQAQRLAAAPGGVRSLAAAPHVLWSAPTDSAADTAYLPGLVVVRRGTALHALDAGTGVDRWQAEVGGDPRCRSDASSHGAGVSDQLVCWGGPNAADEVTVVRADGSSTARTLEPGVAWATGTPDGGLATARTVGPAAALDDVKVTPVDGGGYSVDGRVAQGPDVVIRLEDAATGAPRWERTVAFQPVTDAAGCVTVTEDRTGAQPRYQATVQPPEVVAVGAVLEVYGCGIQAAFTADGTEIGGPGSQWSFAEPYVDGGVLEQVGGYHGDSTVVSVLHGPGGDVTFTAQVLNPQATDGTHPDLVLTGSAAVPLAGRGRDGARRWQGTHTYGGLLVRAAGVAVMSLPDGGGAAGVDLATGHQLWQASGLVPDTPGTATYVAAASTDGRVAALLLARSTTTATEDGGSVSMGTTGADLVGLDLATGAVRWRTPLPGDVATLEAVEGHLVLTTSSSGTLVTGGTGTAVSRQPGTVAVLG